MALSASLDGALCQSVTSHSLLATGRAGVQAITPGLCQSIGYIKIFQKLTPLYFQKVVQWTLTFIDKCSHKKMIPCYTFNFCLNIASWYKGKIFNEKGCVAWLRLTKGRCLTLVCTTSTPDTNYPILAPLTLVSTPGTPDYSVHSWHPRLVSTPGTPDSGCLLTGLHTSTWRPAALYPPILHNKHYTIYYYNILTKHYTMYSYTILNQTLY